MENNDMFNAPIPGQALTGELGSKPWEKPSKYNTVEEALNFYMGQFSKPKALGPFLDQVEKGIPISSLVEALQLSAVMEGLHTIDVGMLVAPILVEYVALQAEEADIEFSIGDEDTDIPDENMIDALVDSLLLGATPEEPSLPPMEEDMDVPEESMGLMRKRSI
tara:strand:- start:621 stop:1112 length:492 start_codon:yes stop_codon:yes gene_type:complete